MRTRRLGRTGLEISVAGFGAWATGGSWKYGLGTQDDAESIAAIHRALELGVNWIDTAAVYGYGHSEEVVALALRGSAERPYLFTKCGLLEGPGGEVLRSLARESIRSECEASLRRLGVDAIDLYQIHWPIPDEDVEEGWAALAELKAEGKVRHIGVSNFDVGQLQRVEAIAPVESLQPPYSLIERGVEEKTLPWCAEHDVGVIVYSPMASGLLGGSMTRERIAAFGEGDMRRTTPAFLELEVSRNLELADRLRTIGERRGVSPGAVAVAWTLRRPEVTAAIVGFRRPAQVDGILPAATELELSDEELAELER